MTTEQKTVSEKGRSVWNVNFFLLFQGQFVSEVGDVFYQVALGFWVLAETGSTALMGTLVAVSVLPTVLISPFAGVLVDRVSRKWFIVGMDFLRSIPVLVVAIGAFRGWIEIWMIFVVAILVGAGGAFFNPAVGSSIPDLVPRKRLLKANSVFGMIQPVSGVIANAAGGLIYGILGAPVMFLVNGVSYLFSSISELFIEIPPVKHESPEFRFFGDMREGLGFVKRNRAVQLLFLNAGVLNFFLSMGGVLILPFFSLSDQWGPAQYGITMSLLTAGGFAGLLVLSSRTIPARLRFSVFAVCAVVFSAGRALLIQFDSLVVIYGIAMVVGATVAALNSFINTVTQTIVPQHLRGKVLALLATGAGSLIPLGMALGGVLAEFIAIRVIMPVTGGIVFLGFLPLLLNRTFREFIGREADEDQEPPEVTEFTAPVKVDGTPPEPDGHE